MLNVWIRIGRSSKDESEVIDTHELIFDEPIITMAKASDRKN